MLPSLGTKCNETRTKSWSLRNVARRNLDSSSCLLPSSAALLIMNSRWVEVGRPTLPSCSFRARNVRDQISPINKMQQGTERNFDSAKFSQNDCIHIGNERCASPISARQMWFSTNAQSQIVYPINWAYKHMPVHPKTCKYMQRRVCTYSSTLATTSRSRGTVGLCLRGIRANTSSSTAYVLSHPLLSAWYAAASALEKKNYRQSARVQPPERLCLIRCSASAVGLEALGMASHTFRRCGQHASGRYFDICAGRTGPVQSARPDMSADGLSSHPVPAQEQYDCITGLGLRSTQDSKRQVFIPHSRQFQVGSRISP
jgi:hypothetical protein